MAAEVALGLHRQGGMDGWPMLWLLLASALLPLALRTAWQARGSAGDDWKPAALAAAGNALREMLWLGLLGPPPGALLLWSWLLLAPGELPVPRRWARHWAACGCCAGYSRWLRRWPSVPGWGHCVLGSAAPGRVLAAAIGVLCTAAFCLGWAWLEDVRSWWWQLPLGGLSALLLAIWWLR